MIVLDTNVLSELMKARPDAQVGVWMQSIDETVATTAITVMEIEYGLRRLPDGRRKVDLGHRFAALATVLTVMPLDDIAAYRAGQFRALREAEGFAPHPSDMMIAGIAASAEARLATRNVKDFQGLPLQLVDPWRPHC